MNRLFVGIVGVFMMVAIFMIVQSTRNESALVLLPSSLFANSSLAIARVRVAGRVAQLPVTYTLSPQAELKFSIHDPAGDPAQTIAVVYAGLKPDMFAPGRDVIIDGEYKDGVLTASKLLTQCPSKYEPPQPGQLSTKPQVAP